MDTFRVRNWRKYQRYTDRRPKWFCIYTTLREDIDFTAAKLGIAPPTDAEIGQRGCIFSLAAKHDDPDRDADGPDLPMDPAWIKKHANLSTLPDLNRLATLCLIECNNLSQDVTNPSAPASDFCASENSNAVLSVPVKDRKQEGGVGGDFRSQMIDAFVVRWRKEHPADFVENAARLYLNRTIDGIAAGYTNRKGSFTAARMKAWATRLSRYDTDAVMTACEVYCDRYSETMDERYMAGIALKMNQLGPKERDLEIARHRQRMGELGIMREVKHG